MERFAEILERPLVACCMIAVALNLWLVSGWSFIVCNSRHAPPGHTCFGLDVHELANVPTLYAIQFGGLLGGIALVRLSERGIRRMVGRG